MPLNYLKYQDRFEDIEELGNDRIGRFMLQELLRKMEQTCRECMRDRMRCTLRPLCPDRIFLNILILLGARASDLPDFCYQVHLRSLQTYLRSKARRVHPKEPRYPLRYFRRFVSFKKGSPEENMKAFAAYLKEATQSPVHSYALEDAWYFGVGQGIFIVDLKRQVVSLDPDGDLIPRQALEPLITFLSGMHKVNLEVLKDMEDTWYLRLVCPPFPQEQLDSIVKPRLATLETHWAFVQLQVTDKATIMLISLDPAPGQAIRLRTLRQTVKLLAEIARAAPKKKKVERSEEREKEEAALPEKPPAPAVETVADARNHS